MQVCHMRNVCTTLLFMVVESRSNGSPCQQYFDVSVAAPEDGEVVMQQEPVDFSFLLLGNSLYSPILIGLILTMLTQGLITETPWPFIQVCR